MLKAIKDIGLKTIFVFLLTVLTTSLINLDVFAQTSNEATSARRQFLFNLGFNDIPQVIRERLQARQYEHELNRRQMLNNIKAYEVVNAGRELSLLIMEAVDSQSKTLDNATELAHFAAKMLALKPQSPPTDYPSEIVTMKTGEERDEALVEWLAKERAREMTEHKSRILSDIASVMFDGKIEGNETKLQRIDQLLSIIVDSMYHDDTIGKGKYFGRSLTALLAREDVLQKKQLAEVQVKQNKKTTYSGLISAELQGKYNLFLENFIGDTIYMQTQNGIQKQKVADGTQMLTRNLSLGSLQISWAAIPKDLKARWKARFKGMIGTPLAGFLYVEPEDMEKGITLSMRIRDRLAQSSVFLRKGLSHIVSFEVKEDPETGIKMARVLDNYPGEIADLTQQEVRTGGVRFTYLEQVLDMSHHSAAYFATPDPEKFQKWSQKNLAENGYQAEFFPSTELELDGVTPKKGSTPKSWKTRISEEEFYQLHSEKDPAKLTKNILTRNMKAMGDFVYRGVTFHWIDPLDFNMVDSGSCSYTIDASSREGSGLPLEQNPSVWHWALRSAASIGKLGKLLKTIPGLEALGEKLLNLPQVQKTMKLTNIDLVAPINLALQPYMDGKMYYLESKTFEQRAQSNYSFDVYREKNQTLTRRILDKVVTVVYNFKKFDVISNAAAAIRAIEYGIVMRSSLGVKTTGFSVDRIAETATEQAKPKVLNEMKKHQSRMCQEFFKN